MYVLRNIEAHSCKHCCCGKAISITYCECVFVALGIQHAMLYCHLACPALPYFSTLSHKGHDFRKKNLPIRCVFWFSVQILSEIFLTIRRTERDITKNVCWSSCKVLVNLVRFWWNLNFLARFSEKTQISNFMKIRQVGAELFHADGQTWRS